MTKYMKNLSQEELPGFHYGTMHPGYLYATAFQYRNRCMLFSTYHVTYKPKKSHSNSMTIVFSPISAWALKFEIVMLTVNKESLFII